MSELSNRMRSLRDAAHLRRLKVSGDYDGSLTVAMMRATMDADSVNVAFDCAFDETRDGPKSWESSRERAEFFVSAANEMAALCDEIERLEAENAALRKSIDDLARTATAPKSHPPEDHAK